MARKPIPGLQEEALSSLASRFPGSATGDVGGSTADTGAGTASGAQIPPNQASSPASANPPGKTAGTPARQGGRGSGWLLTLAVLIALAAALVSLAAPSLRPVVRDAFATYTPDVPQRYVDFLVGQSRETVEIDLAALDGRVAALRKAIEDVTRGGVDKPEIAQFLTGAITTGSARRIVEDMAGLEADIVALKAQQGSDATAASAARDDIVAAVKALEDRTAPALAELRTEQAAAAAAVDQALDGSNARIDALEMETGKAAQDLDTRISGSEQEIASLKDGLSGVDAELPVLSERLSALDGRSAELDERVSGLDDRSVELDKRLSAIDDRVVGAETAAAADRERIVGLDAQLAAQVEAIAAVEASVSGLTVAQINKVRPLMMVMHLGNRISVQRPYARELDLLEAAIGDDAKAGDALASLRRYAETGVRSAGELARIFDAQSKIITTNEQPSRLESLTASVANWVGSTFNVPSVTRNSTGRTIATLETIAASLAGGQLDMALVEAGELTNPRVVFLLKSWRAQTQARLDVNNALAELEGLALDRVSAGD